ncbi:Acetyl-CoA acetyltransferase [Rubrobacter radiotolerans]|uniref:Acetyl-CoA acetyltransferase n=1 Tax=Rubrobacter radiotolerans TaxID=42256 RepID=A0A023X4L6_RUBRA|nr:thiolase [Rubrobacter radiotolerans]AHY46994.1 Acetyl-CoA acetyltransferase [Rubrobacter radiotolerans]MDX5894400.1 thiolase [Rubrobacter radiotolerans]SMC05915.1 Acetyl-CoA acetyltransferase [Rubrobacter radiotolerans DSM 5868]
MNLRGKAAIVGAAESDLGEVGPGFTPLDLIGQAATRALADAGLEKKDVDGLFSASVYYQMPTLSVGEYLGIRPRYSDATMMGGSSFVSHLLHAASAIEAGLCEVALIAYASTQLSDGGFRGVSDPSNPYETPYGPRYPVSMYALAASRHMHEYGTTREQLARVAVAAREWARLNPKAYKRDDLSVEDVLSSRMISSPLSLLDCCLVTDGGGALVVTSAERAKDLRKPPVYILGAGEAHWHRDISRMPDLTVTAAADSGRRAYEMAGIGPGDVDVAMLYDAFTINPILFLEDLGFCEKGEGGAFVEGGRIAPGGELPVNTNGGGLSYNHPGMYGLLLLVEAVRQLRGECGERQVEGADVALAHGNGGVLSSQVTAVLGSASTL